MTKRVKFFLIAFFVSLPFWWGINIFQENLEKFFYAQISKPFEEMVFVNLPEKPQKPELDLQVKSAISIKITPHKEKILFQKEIEKPLPIASLTKLMTALIVFEDPENYNFSKIVTISKEAAKQEDVPEYGNLKMGEKINIEKLLNLMLIYSSNDAAWAFSEEIGPKYFVEKMNQKTKILGMENTNFVNPTGLDPENLYFNQENLNDFNYSTVKDLAKLTKYILNEFPLIFEIASTKPVYPIKNGFSDLSLSQDINIIGGKTGYTDEAGGCIILVFEKSENYFINIILGTKGTEGRISEMKKLIDYVL